MKFRKIIRVPHGEISKIASETKRSTKYVSQALKGEYSTAEAELVRHTALRYHGGYISKEPIIQRI